MAYTESMLNFIDKNQDVINSGNYQKIMENLFNTPSGDLSRKEKQGLCLTLTWVVEGIKGFSLNVDAKPVQVSLTGVLKNRTTYKGSGVPLLPAMYGKTKLRLYQIENGQVKDEKTWKLTNAVDLAKLLGTYNLVILDTPENVSKVKEALEAGSNYVLSLVADERFLLGSVSGHSNSFQTIRPKLVQQLRQFIYDNYGFKGVADKILDQLSPKLDSITV